MNTERNKRIIVWLSVIIAAALLASPFIFLAIEGA
jgi:hypothetical protein